MILTQVPTLYLRNTNYRKEESLNSLYKNSYFRTRTIYNKMALDLSMKSRKRSHRDSESSSSTSTIRTVDEADNLRTDGVLDLSIPGASKKRTLSQSSGCSDYSDTGSVTRRLERTRLQSRTPPTVPAQRVTRQGMCRLYLLLQPLVFYGQNLRENFWRT